MLVFAILAVFIAGLMIGRTPEYLGKKIQAYEMKMVSLAIPHAPALVLAGYGDRRDGGAGQGRHRQSRRARLLRDPLCLHLGRNNNGSAFAGLSANTPFYNVMLAIAMWFGRFAVIVPVLAMAGSLAGKQRLAANAGTMPWPAVHRPADRRCVLVGVLNYVPALALGPVVEHLQLFTRG
jgi:K+-transporting ATPase ATPase A chain